MYQSHSTTSYQAFKTADRKTQKDKVLDYIEGFGDYGRTGFEIAKEYKLAPGTVSARLRDLQEDGLIRKSPETRSYTKINGIQVTANVWKLTQYVPHEAERKRDKAAEAFKLLNEYPLEGLSLDARTLINKLKIILK